MKVEKYIEKGNGYRAIISRDYESLRALEAEYQKIGNKTWFNLHDGCHGQWILTVEMGETKEVVL